MRSYRVYKSGEGPGDTSCPLHRDVRSEKKPKVSSIFVEFVVDILC